MIEGAVGGGFVDETEKELQKEKELAKNVPKGGPKPFGSPTPSLKIPSTSVPKVETNKGLKLFVVEVGERNIGDVMQRVTVPTVSWVGSTLYPILVGNKKIGNKVAILYLAEEEIKL